jgi:YVTN family beta-propeller protein
MATSKFNRLSAFLFGFYVICNLAASPRLAAAPQDAPALDFAYYKANVEPIFLKERPGHARCYGCHSAANRILRLEILSSGSTTWMEEQSRANFKRASQLVSPGNPTASPLLIHPLAPEAGGDAFHSGGRQFASQTDSDWMALADWVRGAKLGATPETNVTGSALIYATNSAGSTIDVIDPAANKVVQVIRGIELPHGVAFSPDGTRVYVSNEFDSVLDVVDRKTGQILNKVALSGGPNNIAVAKDGAFVYVGIRWGPKVVDVIDASSLKVIKSIPVNGNVHNVYVTPDGKYALSGSLESHVITVIDLKAEKAIWEVKFDSGIRPMVFEKNPDGSTSRVFVQLSGFNGFAVVDFAKQAIVAKIKFPEQPGGHGVVEGRMNTPSHGMGITPDGKSLWVNSTVANAVFKYTLPDLKLAGHVALPEVHPLGRPASGSIPEWITFTPDSAFMYVSNSGAGSVSAIDTKGMKLIAEIPVGETPKRINTLVLR